MSNIDDLFRKPNAPSSKRKLEVSHDPSQFYKSPRTSLNGDAKGHNHATVEDEAEDGEDDDDMEAGPALPPDDEEEDGEEDEEGRFFGAGMDEGTVAAMDYIEQRDADAGGGELKEEKYDAAWVRKLALNFEKRISKNAELRAKFEDEPAKFMASEADLDADIKKLSILSEHPELYPEFVKLGCVESLVSLLAHDNTDIAIDAIQLVSELTDDDVSASEEQWSALVDACLEADLLGLLSNLLERFDESEDADRGGVYNCLGIFENLASQTSIATRIGSDAAISNWLIIRIQRVETPIAQNTQYAAEVLTILLQASQEVRANLLGSATSSDNKTNGADNVEPSNIVEILLTLLAPYRRADLTKDSIDEEFVENLFDALTILLDEGPSKQSFVDAEGVELMLIMLREGKMAKPRALRVLDHACGGSQGRVVCEQVVEAQGLKSIFGMFMKERKKKEGRDEVTREDMEHLLGILASLLRSLPSDSAPRIRTLAKFVEKEYEKVGRLVHLRMQYGARVAAIDRQIQEEAEGLDEDEIEERSFDDLSRRMDAGLFILQTVDVILAWLVAEDAGAKKDIVKRLAENAEGLGGLRRTLTEQVNSLGEGEDDDAATTSAEREMLSTLIEFLQ